MIRNLMSKNKEFEKRWAELTKLAEEIKPDLISDEPLKAYQDQLVEKIEEYAQKKAEESGWIFSDESFKREFRPRYEDIIALIKEEK